MTMSRKFLKKKTNFLAHIRYLYSLKSCVLDFLCTLGYVSPILTCQKQINKN